MFCQVQLEKAFDDDRLSHSRIFLMVIHYASIERKKRNIYIFLQQSNLSALFVTVMFGKSTNFAKQIKNKSYSKDVRIKENLSNWNNFSIIAN